MAYKTVIVGVSPTERRPVTGACIQLLPGSGVSVARDVDSGVVLSRDRRKSPYDIALERILAGDPPILTINGEGPNNGAFWVHTDICMSWTPGPGSRYTDLYINDGCPACATCEKQLRLKKRFERLKMMLNELKDVNLYNDRLKNLRLAYLNRARIADIAGCGNEYDGPYNGKLRSYELLRRYLLTVHMWNYLVNQLDCDTSIAVSPEDASGICVHTQRAIPSCGGHAKLSVSISIEPVDVQGELSVFVPSPMLEFKPFSNGAMSGSLVGTTATDALHKTLHIDFGEVGIAGTYHVTAKFLPFINVSITNRDGRPVDLSSPAWTSVVSQAPEDGNYACGDVDFESCTVVTAPKQTPTCDDYNRSRMYPGMTPPGTNRWKLEVAWRLSLNLEGTQTEDGGGEAAEQSGPGVPTPAQQETQGQEGEEADFVKEYKDTYYYETTKSPEPVNGLLLNASWTNINLPSLRDSDMT